MGAAPGSLEIGQIVGHNAEGGTSKAKSANQNSALRFFLTVGSAVIASMARGVSDVNLSPVKMLK